MLMTYGLCVLTGIKDAFVANFGTADALPIAAMMLIALGQDLVGMPKEHEDGWLAVVNGESAPFVCALIWAGYGALKLKALHLAQGTLQESDKELLAIFGVLSLLIVGCVGAYAVYVRFRVMQLQLGE
ncbi:hypothetical protein [Polaromonas sp. CF318]|uniref:hypothetical protein n=1 Tax=Polaromonas sp. CF318 TaxID=1144318 RepID=UPI0012FA1ADB|nr:hypothetical protein [Polaromonas sp. CF318]